MTKYRIEIWNPKTNRYHTAWEGPEQYALTMVNKRYNRRHTRRLIKTTEQVVAKAKKDEYFVGLL